MISARMKASSHRLTNHFGGGSMLTLYRSHDLRNANTGDQITTVAVKGTTAIGATSIDLDSAGLEGTLVASMTFTIAGDATVYTVSASVEAASGELKSVAFSPPLEAEAADDAVVTLSAGASYTAAVSILNPNEEDLGTGLVHEDSLVAVVSADGLGVEITDSDQVTIDGVRKRISLVNPRKTTGTPTSYRLILGSQ